MADDPEKKVEVTEATPVQKSMTNTTLPAYIAEETVEKVERDLIITGDDLANAQETAKELSLDETRTILKDVIQNHENDQNFPVQVLETMKEFVANEDMFLNPEKYQTLISEMRVEAALIQNDSPYPEVRAVSASKSPRCSARSLTKIGRR
jgi:hypothetical protein